MCLFPTSLNHQTTHESKEHLEEYLGLARLPVTFSSEHTFTNALAAFLFAFLLKLKMN